MQRLYGWLVACLKHFLSHHKGLFEKSAIRCCECRANCFTLGFGSLLTQRLSTKCSSTSQRRKQTEYICLIPCQPMLDSRNQLQTYLDYFFKAFAAIFQKIKLQGFPVMIPASDIQSI